VAIASSTVNELGIAIAPEEPEPVDAIIEVHQQIPSLMGNPRAGGMRGHPGHVHLSSAELDEEQDVDPFQEHRVDGE
jgi:hypothetical protein